MNEITSSMLILAGFFLAMFLGGWLHENDMARSCERDGNANAWFNEIKCEVQK